MDLDRAAATQLKPQRSESPPLPAALRVLVIDDEADIGDAISALLRLLDCRVDLSTNSEGALARLRSAPYDLIFCDLMLGEENGVDLVPKLLAINPNVQIVILTAFATIDTAVACIKAGASDYLEKPIDPIRVRKVVEQSAEERRLSRNMSAFERTSMNGLDNLILSSRSSAMQAAIATIVRAAAADVPVLIRGESGTGKSVLARVLHEQSERKGSPFVTVNCPTLNDELLSSELFGHVKGSFTGAIRDQPGKVEAADGGTLFLDELGDLSAGVQAKLLRFLHEHRYERVGDTVTRNADVRIIAATNQDLETLVTSGRFREDLLYRLNVVEITIPALREHSDDIPDLCRHFLALFAKATERPPLELSPVAMQTMMTYPWPGNIRELRNELQRVTVLWPARVIEPPAFTQRINQSVSSGPRIGGEHSLADIESEHIRQVLAKVNTFEEAATILAIEPSTLWRKRKRLGL